jgi:hypothetical protein
VYLGKSGYTLLIERLRADDECPVRDVKWLMPCFQEKLLSISNIEPYCKPTQVIR